MLATVFCFVFFFQAEDGIRDYKVTGVQTCALPIWTSARDYKRARGQNQLSDLHTSPRQSVSGGTRRSPRRFARRARAHYAWERLGLGRWRERCLWVGGGEGRDPETDNVGLSCGGGNGSTNGDHYRRRDRA